MFSIFSITLTENAWILFPCFCTCNGRPFADAPVVTGKTLVGQVLWWLHRVEFWRISVPSYDVMAFCLFLYAIRLALRLNFLNVFRPRWHYSIVFQECPSVAFSFWSVPALIVRRFCRKCLDRWHRAVGARQCFCSSLTLGVSIYCRSLTVPSLQFCLWLLDVCLFHDCAQNINLVIFLACTGVSVAGRCGRWPIDQYCVRDVVLVNVQCMLLSAFNAT